MVPALPRFFERILKKTMHHRAKKRYRDLEPIIHKLTRHLLRWKSQEDIHGAIKTFLHTHPEKDNSFDKIPRSKRARLGVLVAAGRVGGGGVIGRVLPAHQ